MLVMTMEVVPLSSDDGPFGECARDREYLYTSVDGGESFTIGVSNQGVVRGWGIGFYGELGDDSNKKMNPRTLAFHIRCTAVACGLHHVLSLSAEGHVFAWGNNQFSQTAQNPQEKEIVTVPSRVSIATGTTAVQVAAGGNHSFALLANGSLWSWGNNSHGQLGSGDDLMPCAQPRRVTIDGDLQIRQVAGGFAHSAAILSDGGVVTFGWGLYHQLGHGTTADQSVPVKVDALEGLGYGIVAVACGTWHTAAVSSDGDVYTWGWGPDGQLGSIRSPQACVPSVVDTEDGYFSHEDEGHRAIQVVCCARSTLVLTVERRVFCWGMNAEAMAKHTNGISHLQIERLAAGHSHVLILAKHAMNESM